MVDISFVWKKKIQIMLYFDPVNLLNQRCDLIARSKQKINSDYFKKMKWIIK